MLAGDTRVKSHLQKINKIMFQVELLRSLLIISIMKFYIVESYVVKSVTTLPLLDDELSGSEDTLTIFPTFEEKEDHYKEVSEEKEFKLAPTITIVQRNDEGLPRLSFIDNQQMSHVSDLKINRRKRRSSRGKSMASNKNGRRATRHNHRNNGNKSIIIHQATEGVHKTGRLDLSPSLLESLQGYQKIRKAILEIRIRVEGNSRQVLTRRGQKRIGILPFLVRRLDNGKTVIVSRGQARESYPALSPQFGVNHSDRIQHGTWIKRYEFLITHLLQKSTKGKENLTENNSSRPFAWTFPQIELSVVCLKKRKFVSCDKNGVSLEDSPSFLFHTVPN